jgi:hypothetical protein
VAQGKDGLWLAVIRAEENAPAIAFADAFDKVVEVMANGALSKHDIAALTESFLHAQKAFAFMVIADAGGDIGG